MYDVCYILLFAHDLSAELSKLIEAANKVCNQGSQSPVLTILKAFY